ncbi:helix-turn-helix transcriptional regulator [Asanoa siamensis]|uniref:Transcriptional regulator, LuxR family protein n=1 Tax=Asanoa siamensis TaxID=926357 RepID=A0ABQ4CQ05_9ACTN|nr:LuxR family transcriptional regulator [Asanoa siamensis]GIF73360.1 putative transcriptional regulator, LuxR family protein [Asanoa siamensis]
MPQIAQTLLGRATERAALDRLLTDARQGRSGTLVLRGEAGVGKTALLDYAADRAAGSVVLRADGTESEMELPFAGLHQLCAQLLDRLDRLPAPQRDALGVAFGLSTGRPPDRFLVGLAVLTLLAGGVARRPVLALVDDAQWLDRSSVWTLAFVARRLRAEGVALVVAERAGADDSDLTGLPALTVSGLGEPDAHALLATVVHGKLDARVRNRIVAETQGNPLALRELPGLDGGFPSPPDRPIAGRIERGYERRYAALPEPTRRLLLTAAAEPTGDVALLWRAAAAQEIPDDAAAAAESAGLVDLGAHVRFSHPLVRSAIYQGASAGDRRAAHQALAGATDARADPDRRAWHRALAAARPDERVAGELVDSADRAEARGGAAAAAALLERAVALTPDPGRRALRALTAAQAKFDAGGGDAVHTLLATAEVGPLDAVARARLERLRVRVTFAARRGGDAPARLLDAANRLAPLDPDLARETFLEATGAAVYAGRLGHGPGPRETSLAARAAPVRPHPDPATDALLDGLATRFTDGYARGVEPLRRALRAFGTGADEAPLRWLWLVCPVTPEPLAAEIWDDDMWHDLSTRAVDLARDSGALTVLPMALSYRACLHMHAGELAEAARLIDESTTVSAAIGSAPLRYTALVLLAWRGQEAEATAVIEAGGRDAVARGEGRALGLADYATALLCNGLGRYEEAMDAAHRACRYEDLGFYAWALVELVEAAVRTSHRTAAETAMRALDERTLASGTDWALGVRATAAALLSEGGTAEAHYREAVDRLGRTRVALHLARAHLLRGEWLRRENRRRDARAALGQAFEMFDRMGAEGFAERARRELLATGEVVRKRTTDTATDLTRQEIQIAELARDGATNPEIAAQLFLSPRTVEWHLGNVYAKLGISSRRDLRRALPANRVARPVAGQTASWSPGTRL